MADEYDREDDVVEEAVEEEVDLEPTEEVVSEAQKAEAADLAKLLRQHPEIWIPYEEQVFANLNTQTQAPGTDVVPSKLVVNLRDLKSLDSKHTTYPFLSNYEKTKCISYRASQISNGAQPYILVPEGVTDAFEIAKMELEAKRLPYILKRPMPDGSFEVWRLSDLLIW